MQGFLAAEPSNRAPDDESHNGSRMPTIALIIILAASVVGNAAQYSVAQRNFEREEAMRSAIQTSLGTLDSHAKGLVQSSKILATSCPSQLRSVTIGAYRQNMLSATCNVTSQLLVLESMMVIHTRRSLEASLKGKKIKDEITDADAVMLDSAVDKSN